MDFELNESQKILKKAARDFLDKECPRTLVREMEADEKGYSPELQRTMAGLGWFGMVFPEEYGGIGGDFVDLMVLLEEMGRALLPGTFFSTVLLGGLPVLELGNDEQKQRFLPELAGGGTGFTLALVEPGSWYDGDSIEAAARTEGEGYVIDGTKLFVPNAHVSDFIICAARTAEKTAAAEGITLFIIENKAPGVTCNLSRTIGPDKQCEVVFHGAPVPKGNILGELHHGWAYVEKLLEKAAVGKCAEMVGGAQKVLEMTVDYSKQRVQFSRPIGTFQIIQSHCVEMFALIEDARLVTYEAGWMLAQGLPCSREVSMAKACTSDAYQAVVTLAHEVQGGSGFVKDADLPLYTRQAKAAELAFGDGEFHRDRLAAALGL